MILLKLRTETGERDLSFDRDVIRIGRKADNDIVLEDNKSSRFHARIERSGGDFVLVDLGSHNGTQVGGRPVSRHVLGPGDAIRIGETTLTVVSLGSAAPLPPAPPGPLPAVAPTVPPAPLPASPPGAPTAGAAAEPVAPTPRPAPPAAPPPPRLVLALREGGDVRELGFDRSEVRIGRNADNEIALADRKASRYHARIEKTPEGVVLIDLDSQNGTLVGDQKVARHALRPGDVIRIGMTTLTVVSLGDAGPVGPPMDAPAPVPVAQDAPVPTGTAPAAEPVPVAAITPALPGPGDARTRSVRSRGGRSSWRSRLQGVAVFLLLLGGVGYWVIYGTSSRPGRSPARDPRPDSPIPEETVRQDEIDPAWKGLEERVDDALKRGRFDEALGAVTAFRGARSAAPQKGIEGLLARIEAGATADYRRVLERGGALEKDRQADAAIAYYAEQLPRFRGTRCQAPLQDLVKAGGDLAAGVTPPATAVTENRAVEPETPRTPDRAGDSMAASTAADPGRPADAATPAGGLGGSLSPEALDRAVESVLVACRDPGTPEAARGQLRGRTVEAIRRYQEEKLASLLGGAKAPSLTGQLVPMKKELIKRRQAAFKMIFDAGSFTASSAAVDEPGRGWRAVDRFVEPVREAWERPLALVVEPRVAKEVSGVLAATGRHLATLGIDTASVEGGSAAGDWNAAVSASFRSFSLDGPEGATYAWNRRVERYNRALTLPEAGEAIKAQVRILNDYREMMGLRRCVIDPRLCQSSLKHARACNAAGKVWASGPDGTPKARAEAEGFRGGVGENAAIDLESPREIWEKGWYRSGDAHRSVLKETWNCVGFGRDGRVGILTFGNTIPPEGL